uniref:Plant heme peroxidase family profile domain-containing protein n=1 Tax=Oryza glaberrima TaxID=4538 RepID=I1PR63_ORYGL
MGAVSRSGRAVAVLQLVSTVVVLLSPPAAAASREISVDFHAASCPQLETIVRSAVQAALQREIALAAGLLRIFFHDCFPQGCDASVYLNATNPNSEQGMGPNLTLQPRALQLVEDIRAKVHAACGPTVSCADISALATRAAVVVSGGPSYNVTLGQFDSLSPAPENLVNQLPSPFEGKVDEHLKKFQKQGAGRSRRPGGALRRPHRGEGAVRLPQARGRPLLQEVGRQLHRQPHPAAGA